ncbi:hypothetical protein B0T18DRAFT_430225 [Schizothecium vesticola]|uniref:Uncharacterized protein n=1 Tax=Schizothecium vesticola TaxID=314040 RepID=A0AA40ENY0_9PEZI|nr:hypothetical protein B0T18DRAFT_430225 [Schizothecium vesticola]
MGPPDSSKKGDSPKTPTKEGSPKKGDSPNKDRGSAPAPPNTTKSPGLPSADPSPNSDRRMVHLREDSDSDDAVQQQQPSPTPESDGHPTSPKTFRVPDLTDSSAEPSHNSDRRMVQVQEEEDDDADQQHQQHQQPSALSTDRDEGGADAGASTDLPAAEQGEVLDSAPTSGNGLSKSQKKKLKREKKAREAAAAAAAEAKPSAGLEGGEEAKSNLFVTPERKRNKFPTDSPKGKEKARDVKFQDSPAPRHASGGRSLEDEGVYEYHGDEAGTAEKQAFTTPTKPTTPTKFTKHEIGDTINRLTTRIDNDKTPVPAPKGAASTGDHGDFNSVRPSSSPGGPSGGYDPTHGFPTSGLWRRLGSFRWGNNDDETAAATAIPAPKSASSTGDHPHPLADFNTVRPSSSPSRGGGSPGRLFGPPSPRRVRPLPLAPSASANFRLAHPPGMATLFHQPPPKEEEEDIYSASPRSPAPAPGIPAAPGPPSPGEPSIPAPSPPAPGEPVWDEENLEMKGLILEALAGPAPEELERWKVGATDVVLKATKASNPGGLPVFPQYGKSDALEQARIKGEEMRKEYLRHKAEHPEEDEYWDKVAEKMFGKLAEGEKEPVDESEEEEGPGEGPGDWEAVAAVEEGERGGVDEELVIGSRDSGAEGLAPAKPEDRPEPSISLKAAFERIEKPETGGEGGWPVPDEPEDRAGPPMDLKAAFERIEKLEKGAMGPRTRGDLAASTAMSLLAAEKAKAEAAAAVAKLKELEERTRATEETLLNSVRTVRAGMDRLRDEMAVVKADVEGGGFSDQTLFGRVVKAVLLILVPFLFALALGQAALDRNKFLGRYGGIYVNGGFMGFKSYAIFDTYQTLLLYTLASAIFGGGLTWLVGGLLRVL